MQLIINLGLLRSLIRSAELSRVNKLASATIKKISLIKVRSTAGQSKNKYTLFNFKITLLFSIKILRFFF